MENRTAEKKIRNLERILKPLGKRIEKSISTEAIALEIVEAFAKALACEWGTFWLVDQDCLRATAIWSNPKLDARNLDMGTRNKRLSMSQGTAGHVWKRRTPVWTTDLVKDMCLPRSLDADRLGFHGGIWIPVISKQTIYGVVEILGRDIPPSEPGILDKLTSCGLKVGKILEWGGRIQSPQNAK